MVAMIIVVIVMVRVGVLVVALFAVEHQKVQAEGIERRDKHTRQHRKVGKARCRQVAKVHRFNDAVFGIEAREKRGANQGQRAQQEGDPSDGHVLAHRAHPTNVLVVMQTHDDRASSQEQQRFKEGVGHEVEHRHRIGRRAQGHCHIAQLRQRGIRHHALDVVLDDAQEAHEQGGDGTNDQNKVERGVRQLINGRHARHHENACSHHGGGVNQGRDGCGAFHGVGQPHMQRKLR